MNTDFKFSQSGELISLTAGETEFVSSGGGCDIFLIQLRDFIGNELRLSPEDFSSRETVSGGILFSACEKLAGTAVKITVRPENSRLYWKIAIDCPNELFKVEWIDFPRIRLRRFLNGKFLLPFAEGTLVENLDNLVMGAHFRSAYAEYPMTGISGFYPGPAPMQFEAYYTGDAGLYIAAEDPSHAPKTIDVRIAGEDTLQLVFQHFTGGEPSIAYDVVTAGFSGDWQDAAEIYRSWMEQNDPALPEKLSGNMPEWFADSPVLMAYPVKGTGLDIGSVSTNEFYPYKNILPVFDRYKKEWNCRLMALLMHWEGTAPWAPPYVWPPYGGEEEFRDFTDELHSRGDLVGLYCSGIGWTQRSMIDPSYDRSGDFADKQLINKVCRGPKGEAFSRVCNGPRGQRLGYDLCPAVDFTGETVKAEVASASAAGVDYLQYFDQNQGCAAPLCYSGEHGHPSLPGAWQTDAMRELLEEAQKAAGKTVLGCENAAAHPYTGVCRLNDLRYHLAWGYGGRPVPVYPYIFHEYSAGFSGNGVCLSDWIDTAHTPFFLQWVLAWNFVAGNLLSVVLKKGGDIHWNWALPWEKPAPEQQPLVKLIANLAGWRKGPAGKYLIAGRMTKSPAVHCASQTVYRKNTAATEVDMILSSAWTADGKKAVILANCNTVPEPCRIDFGEKVSGVLISSTDENKFESENMCITLPPLDAVMIEY